ncbi:MAG: hypothetical protein MJ204_02800 [Bacteroidales bacterium]|nr:hypothetical protein [Bacteroidales bacterium]MCQ2605457.1 hypothetical protein [Bacteroidales bacterium]
MTNEEKKVLRLPLKKKWFDMIKSGEKKEEYRDIKPFYNARFIKKTLIGPFLKKYDSLIFTCGYTKKGNTEKILSFKNPQIRVGKGKSEWGAIEDKLYYVITWEE